MNNDRRTRIAEAQEEFRNLSARIEEIAEEEREALESLPENFQETDRGERMEQAADALDEVVGQIDEAVDALDDVAAN